MSIFVQIHSLPGERLSQTFENFATLMSNKPGMYFEMDGSFVWVDHETAQVNQMDGMVYDREDRIEYVEIKGACSLHQWLTLCQALCSSEIGQEFVYSEIDSVLRVHRVAMGDWAKPSEIAMQLSSIAAQEIDRTGFT